MSLHNNELCKSFEKIVSSLPSGCEILAVSKLQGEEKIRDLFARGQRKFAENYFQEALQKQLDLKDLDIEWHFIGRLQKNKAKLVVGNFALIHSVDSLALAQILSATAVKKNLTQKILLQMNLAGEATKGGFTKENLSEHLAEVFVLPHLQVVGLMTMPPLADNAEQSRPYFRELKELEVSLSNKHPNMNTLSMGTSIDYKVAAEEGATLVRLGTILFGERPL
jgi:pyridoxal phosphate enzyme (YggS family)